MKDLINAIVKRVDELWEPWYSEGLYAPDELKIPFPNDVLVVIRERCYGEYQIKVLRSGLEVYGVKVDTVKDSYDFLSAVARVKWGEPRKLDVEQVLELLK